MTTRTGASSVAATIWRRLLVLLIGGLVALPYGAIGIWAVSVWVSGQLPLAARLTSLVIVAILVIPAVLPVTRALERTVANQLLDTAIPEPRHRTRPADTARGALFFAGHIASGGILILGIAFVFPLLTVLIADAVAARPSEESATMLRELISVTDVDPAMILIICALASALIVVCTIAAGYLLPWYAQLLLGPSRDELRARDAERTREQQRRGELARDVHDSVGHALTVTMMQALVARGAVESDPDAARAALTEIERVSRGAVAELDYVLSVLRDGDGPRGDRAPEQRTLADVERLVAETRATGFEVDLRIDGALAALPASLGREAYRIVQEGMTNALRYATTPRVTVALTAGAEEVSVVIENETDAARVIAGRGLTGLRERVTLLGGTASTGIHSGRWRLAARLPVRGPQNVRSA
ncbi:sensor histidine kinase [Paramicrobacterium sp. CJ85]|uniref:sensor histidine kinase n=1 Tax=Paramicrobacterium sp. CJ85 TaxID=3445355 RepID=UPI003F5EF259